MNNFPAKAALISQSKIIAEPSRLEKTVPYNFNAYNHVALEYLDRGGMVNARPIDLQQVWFHVRQENSERERPSHHHNWEENREVVCVKIPSYQVDLLLPQEWFKFDNQLNIYILLPEFWRMVRIVDQTNVTKGEVLTNNTDTRLKTLLDPTGNQVLQLFAKPSVYLNQFEYFGRIGVHWINLGQNCSGQTLSAQPRSDPKLPD